MKANSEEIRKRISRFRAGLGRAGVKLTHQRVEIFREVAESVEHPDAETIYRGVRRRIPTVSLDTVYRTLWLLLDLGLIATLDPPRERVRFDGNTGPHHHFVCAKCGMARDFWSEDLDALELPAAVTKLGRIKQTRVQVTGICARCMEKNKR
ncbi:MAG TPA: Fur family transcriptional regulator [bacterium]|nr:Fur family transcriptional regulator [bacterium]